MTVACSDRSNSLRHVTFSNLSAFGIQPGWTCSISGCFILTGFDEPVYAHTPNDSCTLPTDIATTTPTPMVTTINSTEDVMPATNSAEVPTTEVNATTVSGVDITDFQMERNLLLIPIVLIPVFLVLLLLITVVLLMVLILSWLKQQKARKMALLVFDQQNMIFDPGYSPGVCIDKPSFAHAHRTFVVSNTDYLQFLTSMDTMPQFQFSGDVQVTFESNYTNSSILPRTSFSHESSTNNSKQPNNSVGATKEMYGCLKEFSGSGGYVLDEHSNGLTTPPPPMDSNREGFYSPSDNASELTVTLSCGGCQSSDYILNTKGDSSFIQNENNTNSESLSDGSLSLLLPDDNSSIIGLDHHNGHPPSSSSNAGYVEQSITSPNESLNIMLTIDSDVFELDLELTDEQRDGYQPQYPSSNATSLVNQQTAGYVTDLQNTHQVRGNHQEAEVACLDNFDCSVDESVCTQHSQLDMPCLTSIDGYILNEHPTPTAVTTMQDTESLELIITIDDEKSLSQLNDLPGSSLGDRQSVIVRNLDAPSTSDKSSSQGYIHVTTEDIDMTEFTSREIVVPASEISPSQIEPGFTVRLDFDDETKLCKDQMKDQLGYVCNSRYSGMESEQNVNAQNDMDHPQPSIYLDQTFNSNGYVASELEQPTISGTDGREQYVSYDFHSMASELGDSRLDFTNVTLESVHITSDSMCQSPMCLHVQPQSNYYPASDVSSGYLSGSTTSCDTNVYLGMDKLKQVDHNL